MAMTPTDNPDPIDEANPRKRWNLQPSQETSDRFADGFLFWCLAWFGTATAGGIFGALVGVFYGSGLEKSMGAIFGLFFGFHIAGMCAIPVHFHIAFITWAFWLKRFRVAAAALAGGLTGLLAVGATGATNDYLVGMMVAAGLLGAAGSGLVAFRYNRWVNSQGEDRNRPQSRVWQFSLRDLLVHFTAIAVLMSLWASFFAMRRAYQERRDRVQQEQSKEYQR